MTGMKGNQMTRKEPLDLVPVDAALHVARDEDGRRV